MNGVSPHNKDGVRREEDEQASACCAGVAAGSALRAGRGRDRDWWDARYL